MAKDRGRDPQRAMSGSAPRYIRFFLFPYVKPGASTSVWWVLPKDAPEAPGSKLGEIRWFGRWWCYAFFPEAGTVFEQACLRDIAAFAEARTVEWRERCQKERRARRAQDASSRP